jgi:hypothetical protein
MQSRQPACEVGVPEGRFQAEELQQLADPQSSTVIQISASPTILQTQLPSCHVLSPYSTELAERCPNTT